jgi:BolA protein
VVLQQRIESKLKEALAPEHLEVINESHMHKVPKGSQTHWKVVIVTDRFDGLSAVKRHQLVYGVLAEEMQARPGIHALAITSRTPAEWATSPEANQSPLCASKTQQAKAQ